MNSSKWITTGNVVGLGFVLGMLGSFLGFFFLRETFIDIKVMLMIYLIPGFILTPGLYSYWNKLGGKKGHVILHYLLHTVVTGGLILYLFMASNYYFADSKSVERVFEVERVDGYQSRNRTPHVVILINGVERDIYFPKVAPERLRNVKNVKVCFYKGLWNFIVIKNNELIE
jgi:ascorbate-specific PTS system EIIC-type component UlaA